MPAWSTGATSPQLQPHGHLALCAGHRPASTCGDNRRKPNRRQRSCGIGDGVVDRGKLIQDRAIQIQVLDGPQGTQEAQPGVQGGQQLCRRTSASWSCRTSRRSCPLGLSQFFSRAS